MSRCRASLARLVQAILAIEDQRFYDHRGVDIVRVGGAALNNVLEGRLAQGGSTITQQLARQSFLTPDKTIRRKLTEIVVAARLERQYSKDEILAMYLNKVYFGDGLYGVEAASLGYFGKHASEVSVAEAALLAGLVKAPSIVRAHRQRRTRESATQRRAPGDARREDDRPCGVRRRLTRAGRARRRPAARRGVRSVLQGRSAPIPRPALRLGARLSGRTEGLHDSRSRHAESGRECRVALAASPTIEKRQGARKTSGEDSLQAALVAMDPAHRRSARDGRRPRLRSRAPSIAPRRPSASRARRSSRSSTRPRSSAVSRRPRSSRSSTSRS